eukprot:scaffold1987_cov377-Prasinococcus_capsulatus_cf.AAC.8
MCEALQLGGHPHQPSASHMSACKDELEAAAHAGLRCQCRGVAVAAASLRPSRDSGRVRQQVGAHAARTGGGGGHCWHLALLLRYACMPVPAVMLSILLIMMMMLRTRAKPLRGRQRRARAGPQCRPGGVRSLPRSLLLLSPRPFLVPRSRPLPPRRPRRILPSRLLPIDDAAPARPAARPGARGQRVALSGARAATVEAGLAASPA